MSSVKHTMFAAQALSQADMFKALLGSVRLPTSLGDYRPELSAPEGESTGGGKQSVQHIKLLPAQGAGPTLVMGSMDAKVKTAELRSFDGFCQMVDLRFKGAGPRPAGEPYEALVTKIVGFFNSQAVAVTMKGLEAPAAPEGAAPQVPERLATPVPRNRLALALGVALGVSAGVVVALILS
ncbi:MAG: hypothetical protein KA712_25085 [Myxococcales bacterium]|nr:hypothetical protein [Myxococcales bacterium]